MSQTLQQIRELVARREVHVSDHGYDELAEEDIFIWSKDFLRRKR